MTTTDQAFRLGEWARDAKRPRSDCPKYGPTEHDRECERSWLRGWDARDAKLKGRAK